MREAEPQITGAQRNVETVQGIYAAFGRGDLPAVLNAFSDDVEWMVTGPPETSYAGTRRGRAQVVQFFTVLSQTVDIQQFEPREFIAQGDQVVVVGFERLKIRSTGRIAENHWVMIFTLRNGHVARFREYDDSAAVADAFCGGRAAPHA